MQFILWRLAFYTAALLSYVSTSDRIMFGSFQLCSEVWTDNLNMVGLITLRTNVPLQTPVELSNHRADIYAL